MSPERSPWSYPAYVRVPDLGRRREQGSRAYRKGWEVRIVLSDEAMLPAVQEVVREAGFAVSRPFLKGRQVVQPVYGRKAVEAFLAFRATHGATKMPPSASRPPRASPRQRPRK